MFPSINSSLAPDTSLINTRSSEVFVLMLASFDEAALVRVAAFFLGFGFGWSPSPVFLAGVVRIASLEEAAAAPGWKSSRLAMDPGCRK